MRRSAGVLAALLMAACSGAGSGPAQIRPDRCVDGCPLPTVGTLDGQGRAWVDSTLASLTLRERVGQLVIQWLPGNYASPSSPEFQEWADWVARDRIGGIYLSIGLPHQFGAKVNELQALAEVPLLVTSDFENGGPGMRINHSYALPSLLPQGGGTSFPPTMAFGAIGDERFAYEYARITGLEARAVGVNFNFAPVLDVNSNPDNPIINTRAFGESPEQVARLGAAYIRGARAAGMLTTAKHFPGHGDTETDSHVDLPIVPADWERLEAVELVPFQRAIDEGVDAVMTAHVVAAGVGGLDAPPATLDPVFMTELLRERMGFDGILFTDALQMAAITDRYGAAEVAVLALEAGADVLLMPTDIPAAIDAVVASVQAGRMTAARIDASVRRILEAKARAGLHRNRWVDLDLVDDRVGSGPHLAFADTAATRSMTLLRDETGAVPIDAGRRVLSITWARERNLVAGRAFDPEISRAVRSFGAARVGPETTREDYDDLYVRATNADLVLLNAYVPPGAGVGDVGVPEELSSFVAQIAARTPLVVTSFGNPYLLAALPHTPAYLVAWGDREVSQRAAANALLGAEAISGRLPISIPPYHRVGDGLDRNRVTDGPRVDLPPSAISDVAPAGTGESVGAVPRSAPEGPRVTISAFEGDPAAVGMDAGRLAGLDEMLLQAVRDSVTPGAVVAIGRRGRLVRLRGYGTLDWADDSPVVTPGSIYDLASLTKVVGTTSAVMSLVEEGVLGLDDRVVDHLPWWDEGDARKSEVTVRHLLLHRAGLPPFRRWFTDHSGPEEYRAVIGAVKLDRAPGQETVYSDIGFMTLAFIVEAVTGQGVDQVLSERVWGPLGMRDTGFRPDPARRTRIAPTEVDEAFRGRQVHGEVHDENAWAAGGVAGHAGLFSSAWDLSGFARMMLHGGLASACAPEVGAGTLCTESVDDVRVFAPETVERFTRRWDDSASRALGWDTPSGRSSAGDYFTSRAFGHTGFTGTSVWMDPELDLFVVLLTNRVNPTRENSAHVPLRRAVHDLAARSIADVPVPRREDAGSR